jgi:hypothetical protein
MVRKLSLVILIITVLSLALSLTSCDSISAILPPPDSNPAAETAHNIINWITEQFENLFSFDWTKSIWEWIDTTLGVTDKVDQTRAAIDLIKTGNFSNIITGIGTIFSCGILLLVLGLLVISAIVIAVLIELFGKILLTILGIVLGVAVLGLAIMGFVFVILPKL